MSIRFHLNMPALTEHRCSSTITGPDTDPRNLRYYYVIAAVRGTQLSAHSPENGAGVYNGSTIFDPNSANWL